MNFVFSKYSKPGWHSIYIFTLYDINHLIVSFKDMYDSSAFTKHWWMFIPSPSVVILRTTVKFYNFNVCVFSKGDFHYAFTSSSCASSASNSRRLGLISRGLPQ